MASARNPEKKIFIYAQMQPDLANKKLVDCVNKLSPEKLAEAKQSGCKLWLLRESKYEGLLTLHCMSYFSEEHYQLYQPQRLALLDTGWVSANLDKEGFEAILSKLKKVNQHTALRYVNQLEEFLKTKYQLLPENRVNPEVSEQSRATIYSIYCETGSSHNAEEKPAMARSVLDLQPDMKEAITCTLSKKTFVDPVVAVHTLAYYSIKKGVSYDRAELEKLGLRIYEDFYENILLKNIINYMGSTILILEKLGKIEDFERIDTILQDQIKVATITPSGHSYSKIAIEQWIAASGDAVASDPKVPSIKITLQSLVPNTNLDEFISAWPAFYQSRIAMLNYSIATTAVNQPGIRLA
ncbi:MAG: hypothetical protein V4501_05185 [Pseudomonadota bacterium]